MSHFFVIGGICLLLPFPSSVVHSPRWLPAPSGWKSGAKVCLSTKSEEGQTQKMEDLANWWNPQKPVSSSDRSLARWTHWARWGGRSPPGRLARPKGPMAPCCSLPSRSDSGVRWRESCDKEKRSDISIVSIKERPPERKDKCPSDQDIAKGAEVARRGNAFQNLRRETITVVIVIGVLWEYFISRKSYILHLWILGKPSFKKM